MSELICEVTQIGKWEKHPNADTLALTEVYSFPAIFKIGEMNTGDLAVYFPVDAMLPVRPEFAFIWKDKPNPTDKERVIRAVRLRGIFSMGLLVSATKFPEVYGLPPGTNVAELLKIEKYEPPEPFSMGGDNTKTPPWFIHYTDIQSLRKYNSLLLMGEEVIITEKVHGCIPHKERVRMADGTTKCINKIKTGDLVLGVNEEGNVVASKVLKTFNNGKADKWLSIKMTDKGLGRGGHCVLKCTPEHRVYSVAKKEYIAAETLQLGTRVLCVRKDLGLTPLQEQVLLGKVLGDGYINITPSEARAGIVYSHCIKQREYLEWTRRALGNLSLDNVKQHEAGFVGSEGVYTTSTVYSCFIKDLVEDFITDDHGGKVKKHIPSWLPLKLGPIAIAFWYMDDGFISEGRDEGSNAQAGFATHSFCEEDQDVLIEGLKKFGISAEKQHTEGRIRLRLTTENAERLFLLVAPYVPPCMQYKLPERYRGHPGWLPNGSNPYKGSMMEQTILSVEDVTNKIQSFRYDLETETHNYFASDTLVHNCNARYAFVDGQLWVGSHGNTKKLGGGDVWNRVAVELDLAKKLQGYPGLIFFGEVYGQVQGGFDYGIKKGTCSFIVFDIYDIVSSKYLDYDTMCATANAAGLGVVPLLYRGPWDGFTERLQSLAEGDSIVAQSNERQNHIKEGFVIKPVHERWDPSIQRVILKLHGQDFLVGRKKKKE